MLIKPEVIQHSLPVSLSAESLGRDQYVVVKTSEAYRPLIEFLKAQGYVWERFSWRSVFLVLRDHTIEDKLTRIAVLLLSAGFVVDIPENVVDLVLAGDYKEPRQRYVFSRNGAFFIRWSKERDFWSEVNKIPGFQYNNGKYRVPKNRWKEILDFSEQYDFYLSPGSKKLIQSEKEILAGALVFKPVKKSTEGTTLLKDPSEIDPEFLDY